MLNESLVIVTTTDNVPVVFRTISMYEYDMAADEVSAWMAAEGHCPRSDYRVPRRLRGRGNERENYQFLLAAIGIAWSGCHLRRRAQHREPVQDARRQQ